MALNVDEKALKFRDRLIALKEEQRRVAMDIREVGSEMKAAVKQELLTDLAIHGIKIAVKRHFEEPAKRAWRMDAEAFAESLGQLADTPLGQASIRAIR